MALPLLAPSAARAGLTEGEAAAERRAPALSADEIQKRQQSPLTEITGLPLENEFGVREGDGDAIGYTLRFQPVLPIPVGPGWGVVTRTILRLASEATETGERITGLGDTVFTALVTSRRPGSRFAWGVGPGLVFPTGTSELGTEKWSVGPAIGAGVTLGEWVLGVRVIDVLSFAGASDREAVHGMRIQPIVSYNFAGGWSVRTSPNIIADWRAEARDVWLVPVGGGVAKLVRVGEQALTLGVEWYGHVVRPDEAAHSSLRVVAELALPGTK